MISCSSWITWGNDEAALVLFDGRDGSYHALNEAGSAIWRELNAGLEPSAVAERLSAGRRELLDVISKDVDEFVASSLRLGLLQAD